MKARIMGREIEIDEQRVKGGGATPPMKTSRSSVAIRQSCDGANPSPSPPYRSTWESRYAQHLEILSRAGEINGWWYEPIRFRLPGKGNFYKPDFLVKCQQMGATGGFRTWIEIHEIKGWSKNRREGVTKLKTAAGLNPWATFKIITWDKERGQWTEQIVT